MTGGFALIVQLAALDRQVRRLIQLTASLWYAGKTVNVHKLLHMAAARNPRHPLFLFVLLASFLHLECVSIIRVAY